MPHYCMLYAVRFVVLDFLVQCFVTSRIHNSGDCRSTPRIIAMISFSHCIHQIFNHVFWSVVPNGLLKYHTVSRYVRCTGRKMPRKCHDLVSTMQKFYIKRLNIFRLQNFLYIFFIQTFEVVKISF